MFLNALALDLLAADVRRRILVRPGCPPPYVGGWQPPLSVERHLPPDAGQVPAVFVIAQQATQMQSDAVQPAEFDSGALSFGLVFHFRFHSHAFRFLVFDFSLTRNYLNGGRKGLQGCMMRDA